MASRPRSARTRGQRTNHGGIGGGSAARASSSSATASSFDTRPLSTALEQNRILQRAVQQQLAAIRHAQADNRAQAAAKISQLLVRDGSVAVRHDDDDNDNQHPQLASTVPQNRSWDRRFFSYRTKKPVRRDEPEPNADTVRRRQVSAFFHHSQPPWTRKERQVLERAVATKSTDDKSDDDKSDDDDDGDDHDDESQQEQPHTPAAPWTMSELKAVAAQVNTSSKQQDAAGTTAATAKAGRRSPEECRLALLEIQSDPFSNSERTALIARIQKQQQQHATRNTTTTFRIDWPALAATTTTNTTPDDASKTADQTDSASAPRTPWELFVEYQRSSLVRPKHEWTRPQDEFLVRYVAAWGPQMVWDGSEIGLLRSTPLLASKNKNQLYNRIHQSLVNPNLKHEAWDDTEERTLAICMKAYSDQQPRSLYLAGGHLEGRSVMSVGDKWNRSLNPQYSARPFTKEEDHALLQAMRKDKDLGWTEIANKHFPDRHPHRLMNRWSEIATDDDILSRSKDARFAQQSQLAQQQGKSKSEPKVGTKRKR